MRPRRAIPGAAAEAISPAAAALALLAALALAALPGALADHLRGATLDALPGTTAAVPGEGPLARNAVTFLYRAEFSGDGTTAGWLGLDFGDGTCGRIRDDLTGGVWLPLPPASAPATGWSVDCRTLRPVGTFPVRAAATEPVDRGVQVLSFEHRYPGPGSFTVRWGVCCPASGGDLAVRVLPVGLG